MSSEGELGTSSRGPPLLGLQLPPLKEFLNHHSKIKRAGVMTGHCRSTCATITGFDSPRTVSFNYVFSFLESLQLRSESAMPIILSARKSAV